ncbi:hypothetical protein VTK56DRAFT_3684 [Thermocarpiscus australiensis]
MLFAILFAFGRFMEIITLIPIMGMLAWFVNGYVESNMLTPSYILILFIVSVLALAWALFTLFSYHRSSANAQFVALVDLAFVGALIAGVYYLRFVARADCASVRPGSPVDIDLGIFGSAHVNTGVDVSIDKSCAMLKACFALGIMDCVLFFVTSVLAWIHGDHAAKEERRYYVERRRGHRSHRSRSGSHRRSSHSHHRAYV